MGMLEGKVAIVTGAGGGLGRAHALRLSSEGANVIVNDLGAAAHDVVAEIEATGGTAAANIASVADFAAAEAMVRQAIERFGTLDIVVNNAGALRDAMPFNMTEDQWDLVVDVHLKGHFNLCRHAVSYWREQHKAGNAAPRRIINTTSEAGLYGSPGQVNYASAKGGIILMTVSLARVMERFNTTVNCIAPRARTSMTEAQPLFAKKDFGGLDPYQPEHVAQVVAWLARDSSSDINGQTFIAVGAQLHVVDLFPIVGSVSQDKPWTSADLDARKAELFGARGSGLPPWGGPAWA
jgi:NAD(P)-dependent dehydrogenase (short-subunit alcohol dehydrogenase family)